MMLGARMAALAKIGGGVPTARDYVQDGLIAMWDGIENAGWGVHDPNATTWKDLTGHGYDCYNKNLSRYEWTTNSLMRKAEYISILTGAAFIVSKEKSRQLYSAIATSSTIQIVAAPTDGFPPTYNWAYQVFYISSLSNSNVILGMFLSDTSVGFATKAPNATAAINKTISPALSVSELGHASISMATDSTLGVCILRLNNGHATTLYPTFADREENTEQIIIPNVGNGKTHCIRIYTRALTDDEIAHNYAIDKVRFGLT